MHLAHGIDKHFLHAHIQHRPGLDWSQHYQKYKENLSQHRFNLPLFLKKCHCLKVDILNTQSIRHKSV
jgi:hypothetical protein